MDERHDKLAALFAAARDDAPSAALQARVLNDAAAVQADADATGISPSRRRGPLSGFAAALGGWPSLSGAALAGLVGVAVGYFAPDLVDTLTGGAVWSLTGGAGVTPDIAGLWTEPGDV